jgi:hypothetical protein
MADTANKHLIDAYLKTLTDIATAAHAYTRLRNPPAHAINQITVNPPDMVHWHCQCGEHGTCPRTIALYVLATHLNQDQA